MSEVEAISKIVTGAALVPSIISDKWGRSHAFIPSGNGQFRREDITPPGAVRIEPAFIDAGVGIDQAASLVDYVNRFKTDDTVIFASLDDREIAAVIDYHKAKSEKPGLVEHRAILTLNYSQEWQTWASISGRMYDQKAFAKMLDVNSDDILSPTGAELLEKVMEMEMSSTVTVQRTLVQTGSSRGGNAISRKIEGTALPAFFVLNIPVFTGEPPVKVRAQTLDSLDGNSGKLSLGLELVRAKITEEGEIARIAREIATKTSVPVMLGKVGE